MRTCVAIRAIICIGVCVAPVGMPALARQNKPIRASAGDDSAADHPLGFVIHDALVTDCLSLQDDGDSARAIRRLSDAIKNAQGQPLERLNARRLGLGLVLLRSGDGHAAQRVLLPLSKLKQTGMLKRQAQFLSDIAALQARREHPATAALTDAQWHESLRIIADTLCQKVESNHERLTKAIEQAQWQNLPPLLTDTQEQIDRLGVVVTDAMKQRHTDLRIAHARNLADAVRRVNVVIADLIRQSAGLGGQMTMRSDSNTGRRGYVPADVVRQYNDIVERILRANTVGEHFVAEYTRAVDTLDGRLKRDTAVKMTRTSLPGKRVVFGGP